MNLIHKQRKINIFRASLYKLSIYYLLLLLPAVSQAMSPEDLMDAEKAFFASAYMQDQTTLILNYQIADGYYMYKHRFKFSSDDSNVTLGEPNIPQGKLKVDEYFGEVETFRDELEISIPVTYAGSESPKSFILNASSQGCADIGVCYPPHTQKINIAVSEGGLLSSAAIDTETNVNNNKIPEQDRIANVLSSGTLLATVLSFFGFGLLLAFTPCVFPMIPILSGIIVGQGETINTIKAFWLSLVYVLAMAVTYTVVGVLVGLSGENIQAIFQNPWVLSIFAIIFGLLSLSMFGFYELQMPNAIQSRLTSISNSQRSGNLMGVAIMGFLSALIVGPCVTAPLIGALIYIAQTGDAVLGGLALFALSMGMGAPLLVIGTSAGKILPKVGPWMEATKSVFGVLLLVVAVWLLERILPATITVALYAVLLIVSAVYMGALDAVKGSGWYKLWKGLGLIMLLYGMLLLIGVAGGNASLLHPLKYLANTSVTTTSNKSNVASRVDFQYIKGLNGLDQALAEAEGKPVMLDFYADWCVSCKEMEAFTFTDSEVQESLNSFITLKTDVTKNDSLDKELLKSFGLFGPPAILFFNIEGQEIDEYRVVGYVKAADFNKHLQEFLSDQG